VQRIPDLLGLVTRTAAGDQRAQSHLLRELYPPVRRHLRRWLGSRPDAVDIAEDLTQETLYQVARSIATCTATTEGQAFSWVLAIARNCAAGDLRRRRKELARRADPRDLDLASQVAAYQEWTRGDGEHSLPFSALLCLLRAAGSALPGDVQSLVWLRVVEGAPWSDIAAGLGTTYGAAQRRFQRLQAALRREVLGGVGDLPEPERSAVLAQLTLFADRGTRQ
jgi:RNA polymerase sigma factor (sigma-70 family)